MNNKEIFNIAGGKIGIQGTAEMLNQRDCSKARRLICYQSEGARYRSDIRVVVM